MARTRIWTSARIGAGLAIATAGLVAAIGPATPAGAATIAATGATITRTDAAAGTTLTVKATVARLDLWCTSNKLVVNKKATPIPCDKLLSVTTTGLTGNDAVEINATNFGSALPKTTLVVKTGAGNDTINVRHNGNLTVYAGAGNDKIGAGLASGKHPVSETLLGEDGNDTLSNYGFITAPRVEYAGTPAGIAASKAVRSNLRGGPGADRYVEDDWRLSDLTLDASDAVTHKEGPATYSPERATTTAAPWTFDLAGGNPYDPDTLTMGTATSLTVGCATVGTNTVTRVNGLNIPADCSYHALQINGTDRADTVTYDQKLRNGFGKHGMNVSIDLKGGDDVGTARVPLGHANIDGGAGNDRLSIGLYNGLGNADGAGGGGLDGGAGTDTLTNLGFLDPNPPAYVPGNGVGSYDFGISLDGGTGADKLNGAATTLDSFVVEQSDTVVDPGGPAFFHLAGSAGDDTITVTGRGASGTIVSIARDGVGKQFVLSPLAISLSVDAGAGDDNLSALDGSKYTEVMIDPGDGIDALTTRFLTSATTETTPDGRFTYVRQPGFQLVGWVAPNLELRFVYPEN